MIIEVTNLDEAREVIQELEERVEQLEEIEIELVEDYNKLCDHYDTMEDYYTTDPIVVLDNDQWDICWRAMCKRIDGVPSWCDYPKYLGLGVVYANSSKYNLHGHDEGIVITFDCPENAMAFKLEWS